MSMTRKHYIAMANVLKSRGEVIAATAERSAPENGGSPLKEAYAAGQIMSWNLCVIDTAKWFHTDNPRFDRGKFYVACGYSEE